MSIIYSPESLATLQKFYAALQPDTDRLENIHRGKLQCKKGCSACCEDNLEVFGIEAENIRITQKEFLEKEKAHPKGKCAFLDQEGACRIYASRPYVCRTQGLPLRILNEKGKEIRDVCPLNLTDRKLEQIPEEQLLHTSAYEDFLARLQMAVDKGKMERIKLRDLFNEKRE